MKSGLYKITNTATGDCYIGSSVNVDKRIYMHKWHLRRGKHHSARMQRAWNKYGENLFTFEKLWSVEPEKECLLYEEQLALNNIVCAYNCSPTAGSQLGIKRSKITKDRIGAAHKGKKFPEEAKQRLRERNVGSKHSPEAVEKIREASKRMWQDETAKAAIIAKLKKVVISDSHKEALRQAQRNRGKGVYFRKATNRWAGQYRTTTGKRIVKLFIDEADALAWVADMRIKND